MNTTIVIIISLCVLGYIKYEEVYNILTKGFEEKEILAGDNFYDYIEENGKSLKLFRHLRLNIILYLVLRKLYDEGKIYPLVKKTGLESFSEEEYKFVINNIWRSNSFKKN